MVGVATGINCAPTAQTTFDLTKSASCAQTLQELFQAYINVTTGNARIIMRFGERWSQYQRGEAKGILAMYNALYAQCPDAARVGLPNLTAGQRVRRGPPASGIQFFPRA